MNDESGRPAAPSWPSWLETLRPDTLSRRRIRRIVLARARPLLRERRPAGAWEVTAGWADVLVPVTAVASVLFVVLALRADRPPTTATVAAGGSAEEPVRIEELLAEPSGTEPPSLLTRSEQPDLDGILEAAILFDSER